MAIKSTNNGGGVDWSEQERIVAEIAAKEEGCDKDEITVAKVEGKWKTENESCVHISDIHGLQEDGVIEGYEVKEICNRVVAAVGISPEIGRLSTLAVTPDGWAYLIIGRTVVQLWVEESTRMFT
jgi:hypothetical protein